MALRFGPMVCLFSLLLAVKSGAQQPDSGAAVPLPKTAAVHGIVKNAFTGEPLPRVLVQVFAPGQLGVLTDGEGRFEIDGVPIGTTSLQIARPGFEDAADAGFGHQNGPAILGNPHTITVAEQMPDLELAMRPLNIIRGRIDLSSGDPGENFSVQLLAQSVNDGRLMWNQVAMTQTHMDGTYRFGALSDGTYAVVTLPFMDRVSGQLASGGLLDATGYARTFYPDVRNFSGAARIRVEGGQTVQANFVLRPEAFHLVRARVSGVGQTARMNPAGSGGAFPSNGVQARVLDSEGHDLPYPARYDFEKQTIEAALPDGDYTIRATMFPLSSTGVVGLHRLQPSISGQTDVAVNGHAVTNLQVALGPVNAAQLQVLVNRTNPQAPEGVQTGSGIFITATQAGSTQAINMEFGRGDGAGSMEMSPLPPGAYWLRTAIGLPGLCESSFTAGGANLGHEPLLVGQGGSTAPLTLVLRDDCASLKLTLPGPLQGAAPGQTDTCFVYVVPDFDSTTSAYPVRLLASVFSSTTLSNLTPGAYHVYAVATARSLPFRDKEAMAALNLPSQAITLSPSSTTNLVVEVPAQ